MPNAASTDLTDGHRVNLGNLRNLRIRRFGFLTASTQAFTTKTPSHKEHLLAWRLCGFVLKTQRASGKSTQSADSSCAWKLESRADLS